jgi:hypothetical protein
MVELDVVEVCRELRDPATADRDDWDHVREVLARIVGEATFAIWLDAPRLAAVGPGDALVVIAPEPTRAWLVKRFRRAIERAGAHVGREVVIAEREQMLAIEGGGIRSVGASEGNEPNRDSRGSRSPPRPASREHGRRAPAPRLDIDPGNDDVLKEAG